MILDPVIAIASPILVSINNSDSDCRWVTNSEIKTSLVTQRVSPVSVYLIRICSPFCFSILTVLPFLESGLVTFVVLASSGRSITFSFSQPLSPLNKLSRS